MVAQKDWDANPYGQRLGARLCRPLSPDFALGSHWRWDGGRQRPILPEGLASASWVLDGGSTVGALVAANPGRGTSVTVGQGAAFLGCAIRVAGVNSAGLAPAPHAVLRRAARWTKLSAREATTLAIVATDLPAADTRPNLPPGWPLPRMTVMARAIVPSPHTMFCYWHDITSLAVSTGHQDLPHRGEGRWVRFAASRAAAPLPCLCVLPLRVLYLSNPPACIVVSGTYSQSASCAGLGHPRRRSTKQSAMNSEHGIRSGPGPHWACFSLCPIRCLGG